VLLWVFRASEALFQTAWFVESLATQTLVLFVIRTAGNPLRSRPSLPLAVTTVLVVLIGVILPFTPLAATLGFVPLSGRVLRVPRRSHHDLSRPRRAGQTPTDAQTARHGPRTTCGDSHASIIGPLMQEGPIGEA
jgi:hypothetical protein